MEFFQNKNISLKTISVFISIFVLILFSIIFLLIKSVDINVFNLWYLVFFLVFLFLFFYLTIRWIIGQFIYRKIKVIYKIITKDRKNKNAQLTLNSDDILGKLAEDVDEYEQDRLTQINTLKVSEQFRKEFLGNVSHELKTPIFNLQGFLDTILENPNMDEKTKLHYIQKASENTERLSLIVRDLLLINQYETNSLKLQITAFDIVQLIEHCFKELETQLLQKSIKYSIKEGCNEEITVHGDQDKIMEVLNNLISNAIHYGFTKGSIQIGIYKLEKNVLVEVTDNGPGIEEEHLSRLFERFYRVDKHRNRALGGTGLGLSIVKHIIESHGQQLGVRSTVGKGSTFWFTLPM
ncbi:MAG TPA: ATP-binding protein [Saprospiraceae bacterium]|nr:ATP-binding protein [Saprospiraceae bacterium]